MKVKQIISKALIFIILILLLNNVLGILGINPIATVFLISILFYLKTQPKTAKNNGSNFLNITLLCLAFLAVSNFIIKNQLPFYLIPFSIIAMLATLLYSDLQISLFISLILSMLLALLAKNDLYLGILSLSISIISSLLVLGGRRRSQIIRAGMFIGLFQALALLFLQNFKILEPKTYLLIFLNGFICTVVVVGILPIFEYLFKTITNISLLELSDLTHPLLKAMILKAAGTYHHSLIVGNLSEAACEAVGANALLARIGAYYHDIGKTEKAEYFSENQFPHLTKHDALSPSMSKMVIINHVKEGEDLAKRYRLNPQIIDFILQHHGTSLVYYFYRRALENFEETPEIEEEGFRYPGPKPNKKETAIVLLADSVEAASRTLKEPTPAKIEELVHKIINNKFIDGQLDECDLTLRDLEKIAKIFIRILVSIYHARITYPESNISSK